MISPERIDQLVSELVADDHRLLGHEDRVRQIVMALLQSQPTVHIDEQFRAALRERLRTIQPEAGPAVRTSWFGWLSVHPMVPAVSLLVLVVAVGISWYVWRQPSGTDDIFTPPGGIQQLSANAFGDLSLSNPASSRQSTNVADEIASDTKETAIEPGTFPAPDQNVEITSYRYVYSGEFPDIPASSQVVRRIRPTASVSANLESYGLDLMRMSSFADLETRHVSLTQTTEDGYAIDINVQDGLISISSDMLYATRDLAVDCVGEDCAETAATPQGTADIPADETLITAARSFLDAHGISYSEYGQPEVVPVAGYGGVEPLLYRESAPYVSSMTVIFPLQIGGLSVYSAYGEQQGLQVTLSVPDLRVSSVYPLQSMNFDSSEYANETDVDQLRAIIERGGLYEYQPEPATNTVEIRLQAPEFSYIIMSQYDDTGTYELYVPALTFAIDPADAEKSPWKQRVVVPLAAELIETQGVVTGNAGSGTATMPVPIDDLSR